MTNEQQIRYDHALDIAAKTGFTQAQIDEIAPAAKLLLEKNWESFLAFEKSMLARDDSWEPLLAVTRAVALEDDFGMLVMSLLLTWAAHEYYRDHGIDEKIYLASMRDIWVWTQTCLENRHKLGMYQYSWIRNFLTAQIVRLHRLEFHEIRYELDEPYTACGITVKKGDTVINTHIPADGHMDPADVDESFRQAYRYFGKSGITPIVCESWLLYPKNRLFCAPGSRMVSFLEHFTIVESGDLPDSHDKWRVFGHLEDYTPEKLPENTPLQKQLKAHLASGGTMGYGYGIFLHDGERRVDGPEITDELHPCGIALPCQPKQCRCLPAGAAPLKMVVLDGFAVNPGDLSWDFLSKYGEVAVYDKTPNEKAAEIIGDADAVFTNRVLINQAVLDACPNLKYVSALGTGYDMIDVAACRAKNVEVCNVPGYSTMSVAQHAFTLLLSFAADLDGYCQIVRDGKWTGIPGFQYQKVRFQELAGKTVGVYGCGAIGQAFGRMCQAFGMEVLGTRRSKTDGIEDGIRYVTPEVLLSSADYLSLHCPLTPETRAMVNADFIARMKPGAVLINTSRGAVLNEADVAAALREGKLGGAGLDVLAVEPADPANPLLTAPNCRITPHCAWTSREARLRLLDILDANLASFVENGCGVNRVL